MLKKMVRTILYHPRKANVVDDKKKLVTEVHRLAGLGVRPQDSPKGK